MTENLGAYRILILTASNISVSPRFPHLGFMGDLAKFSSDTMVSFVGEGYSFS